MDVRLPKRDYRYATLSVAEFLGICEQLMNHPLSDALVETNARIFVDRRKKLAVFTMGYYGNDASGN